MSLESRPLIESGEPVEQVEIPDTMWMGFHRVRVHINDYNSIYVSESFI